METGNKPAPKQSMIVLLIMAACLTLLPLKILSYGYMPEDDALRHVAKAFSHKDWGEILILDKSIYKGMDTHPGWHFLLETGVKVGINTPDNLLIFAIIVLWLCATIPPLFYFKHPESFLSAFFLISLFDFNPVYRLFWGRPYILTVPAIMALLHLSNKLSFPNKEHKKAIYAGMVLIAAFFAFMQSSFYLLYVIPFGILLTRSAKDSLNITLAITAGIFIACLLTLHPINYPIYQMKHLAAVLLQPKLHQNVVVNELSSGHIPPLVILLTLNILLFSLARSKGSFCKITSNPSFVLTLLGLAGGFFVWRLWTEIGFAALLYWASQEIDSFFQENHEPSFFRRIIFTSILCLVLYHTVSQDTGQRWTKNSMIKLKRFAQSIEQDRDWLPEVGGIVYSPSMKIFFNMFYLYPKAPWKYALGFEPGIMSKENAVIHSRIEKEQSFTSLLPWVHKMKNEDRFIIPSSAAHAPPLNELKWKRLNSEYWIGRI